MKRKSNRLVLVFISLSLIVIFSECFFIRVNAWEIDETGTATYIVDGDTLDVSGVGRIRLADIDCPEIGDPGSTEATQYLTSLVYQKVVYVDIDDITGTDPYGRWVAVIYVYYNATHLTNVNKALLDAGHAVIWDFDNNEFNPYTWTLLVEYQSNPPPTPPPPSPPPYDPPDDPTPDPSPDSPNNQMIPIIMSFGIGAGISALIVVVIVGLYTTNTITVLKEKFKGLKQKSLFKDKLKRQQQNEIVMVEDLLVNSVVADLLTRYADNIIGVYGIGSYFDDSLPQNWEKNDIDIVVIVNSLDKIPKQDWIDIRYEKKEIDDHQIWLGFNTVNAYQNRANFQKESFSNYEWSLIDLKKPENSTLLYGTNIRDQVPQIHEVTFDYDDILARGLYHLDKSLGERDQNIAMREFSKGVFKTAFYCCIYFNENFRDTGVLQIGKKLKETCEIVSKIGDMYGYFEETLIFRSTGTYMTEFEKLRGEFITFIFSLLETGGLHKKMTSPEIRDYLATSFRGLPHLIQFLKKSQVAIEL